MARIRSIKPEYWTDELLGQMTPEARLLFIAIWNHADDAGRFQASPAALKAQAFLHDEKTSRERVRLALEELAEARRVTLYEVEGQAYGAIRHWARHQKIDHPSGPRFPEPQAAENNGNTQNPREGSRGTREGSRLITTTITTSTAKAVLLPPSPPLSAPLRGSSNSGDPPPAETGGEAAPASPSPSPPFPPPSVIQTHNRQEPLGRVGAEGGATSPLPGLENAPAGRVARPEAWPERFRWCREAVLSAVGRIHPGDDRQREYWDDPVHWLRIEQIVDSWGDPLPGAFADTLEAQFAEFLDHWKHTIGKRKDMKATWRNRVKAWHDRNVWRSRKGAMKPNENSNGRNYRR